MASTRRRFLVLAGHGLAWLLAAPGLARAQEKIRGIHRATRNTLAGAVGVRLRRLLGRPSRHKAYPGRERLALEAGAPEPGLALAKALARHEPAAGFAAAELPRDTLERLLHLTNGITGRGPGGLGLRAAPSAGALYAGEVYVVVERVAGMAPGVYHYSPVEASWVVLDRGSRMDVVVRSLAEPGRARGAAAAVLLSNVFGRYRWRYANRGYRYALIDSGHIGENLRLAATSAGMAEWGPLDFHDDRLNGLLGLDGVDEAVCAVHVLGTRGEGEGGAAPPRSLVEAHRAGTPLPEAADDPPERYHAWTRLVPASAGMAAGASGDDPGPVDGPSGARRLPEPRVPGASVERTILARRSARRFRRDPVPERDLAFALRAALGNPALRRAREIELRIVVHRVDGLAPGLYGVRRGGREIVPLREGALEEDLVDACLGQDKAGEAAVAVVMVAGLEAAAARGGERAWRDLCLEAGAIGQRLYLAAEGLGLAARNLAAYLDDRLDALVGVDGRRHASLHLTVLGPGD